VELATVTVPVMVRDERLIGDRAPRRHAHTELIFVTDGHGAYQTEWREEPVQRGVFLLAPAGASHAWRVRAPLSVTRVAFPACGLRNELDWVRRLPGSGGYFEDAPDEGLPSRLWRLDEELFAAALAEVSRIASAAGIPPFAVLAPLMELFGLLDPLLRTPVERRPARPGRPGPSRRREEMRPVTAQTMALLEEDIGAAWTLKALAGRAHLSPSQLNRVFGADTGTTPLGYLRRLRAERLAFLLRTTELPIGQAGAQVGWTDPANATKRFRQYWGTLPSEYRAQLRS
jgi:AraC family L-rhamnose operon transcriptional activator RhaR